MAKHPTSSRVQREDHGPDDAFVSGIKRTYVWSRENSRVLAITLGVVAVVAVAAFWYTSQQRQLENQAAARFTQVQQTVASGNVQLAIRDLETYLSQFGGTEAANQARLLLASILMEQDQPDEAMDALGSLPDDIDEPFGLPAARIQAAALEESGNLDEAAAAYQRIARDARFTFERREALADAARVRFQEGEPEAAARLYQEIVDTFEADEQGRGYYEIRLGEARAAAGSIVAASPAPASADTTGNDDAGNDDPDTDATG